MSSSRRRASCVLTIAGSDSGAGAGIQADARTIQALGGYALTAVTAITAQNTRGVAAWRAISPWLISAQIEAVIGDFRVSAIKTGLIPGVAAVRAIAKSLDGHRDIPLVVDPVIASTSGARFLSDRGVRVLMVELFPRAALVTPNWPEAGEMTGLRLRSSEDAEEAAQKLLETGCAAVLVKGGHSVGPVCRDCLATSDGRVRWFESPRVATANTHGTGCALSAAIAHFLAKGAAVEIAVARARRFLHRGLLAGRNRRWGRGAGPAFAG